VSHHVRRFRTGVVSIWSGFVEGKTYVVVHSEGFCGRRSSTLWRWKRCLSCDRKHSHNWNLSRNKTGDGRKSGGRSQTISNVQLHLEKYKGLEKRNTIETDIEDFYKYKISALAASLTGTISRMYIACVPAAVS
jgi:hypothetical protein